MEMQIIISSESIINEKKLFCKFLLSISNIIKSYLKIFTKAFYRRRTPEAYEALTVILSSIHAANLYKSSNKNSSIYAY
jgi:hypothetical protein